MRRIKSLALLLIVLGLVASSGAGTGIVFATPASYNDANFQLVWERTDKAVQDGMTARSWMWGPATVPGSSATEPYAEAPGGNRTVQYFDKSRMEVNDPAGDRSSLWFVTNGLLVKEMVSGKVQTGDAGFTNKGASTQAIAGDPASVNANCPTYATFTGIASLNLDHPSVSKTGTAVTEAIDKAGMISTMLPSPDPSVTYAYFDGTLKHNIPNKMWDFMNQSGLVYWNGGWNTETVINWVFAMGYPITEAYWTKAKVGGVEKDVLVQLYERRVLTYTPSNPAGFQVEMGNVGQHYYNWRYVAPPAEERIVFVSVRSGSYQIHSMKTTGGDVRQLTSAGGINVFPNWSPDNSKIVFYSTRDGNSEIYVMNADGTNQQRLTFDAGSDDEQPSWSPDGSRIAWTKNGDIYTMASNGGDVQQLTNTPAFHEGYPIYSPDGTRMTVTSDIAGNYEVYTGNVDGTGVARRTFRAATLDFPTDWHGTKILLRSWAGAVSQIWSMDEDGGSQVLVSGDSDVGATYSPDSSKIVVQHDFEIYVMNSDGSGMVNITNAAGFDGDPDWSN